MSPAQLVAYCDPVSSSMPDGSEPNSNLEPSSRPWIGVAATLLSFVFSFGIGMVSNLATGADVGNIPKAAVWMAVAFLAVLTVIVGRVFRWNERLTEGIAEDSKQAFSSAVEQTVAALEKTLPTPEKSLEDEIAEVSGSLSRTVARLRQISDKAQAFEADVKDLVAKADAARATAKLHEEDARKIALLLGSETEQRIRSEINTLKVEHERQINLLRRSGNRMALWTFVGGVVLGIVGNIVVAVLIN